MHCDSIFRISGQILPPFLKVATHSISEVTKYDKSEQSQFSKVVVFLDRRVAHSRNLSILANDVYLDGIT